VHTIRFCSVVFGVMSSLAVIHMTLKNCKRSKILYRLSKWYLLQLGLLVFLLSTMHFVPYDSTKKKRILVSSQIGNVFLLTIVITP